MSIVGPLTKIAVIVGIGAVSYYLAVSGALPFGRPPAPIERGYANPEQVKLHAPVNKNGNRELFLTYESGEKKASLPVLEGPNGPLVGSAEYYWSSIGAEAKSLLVEGSWDELQLETRKSILKSSLEALIENYGTGDAKSEKTEKQKILKKR